MLTTERLLTLMADHESDRVEMTVAVKDTDKFGEAICAFANDFPNHRQRRGPGRPEPAGPLAGTARAGRQAAALIGICRALLAWFLGTRSVSNPSVNSAFTPW